MKRMLALLLALLMVFSLVACGAKEEAPAAKEEPKTEAPKEEAKEEAPAAEPEATEERPVLGLCIYGIEFEYFANLAKWMEKAAADHGWDIKIASGDLGDPSSQVEIIENFITLGVDAIFINPINIAATDAALERAKEQGIWILGHNYQPGDSEVPHVLVSGSPFEAGEQIALLAQKLVDSGKYVKEGTPVKFAALVDWTNENNSNRIRAMIDKAKEIWGEDAYVGEGTVGANLAADAMAIAENLTQVHPDINVWLCFSDEGAMGVQEFYNASGQEQDDVIIVGLDGTKAALEAIAEGGAFRGTVSQALHINAQRYMDAADILLESGDIEAAQAVVQGNGFEDVTMDNIQEYLDAANS